MHRIPKSLLGKVLRLKDDGSVPQDNPFVGKPDHRPEIYTLGHRSSMGLTVRPGNQRSLAQRNGSERW